MRSFFDLFRARTLEGIEQISAGKRVLGIIPTTAHAYRIGVTLVDAGPPNKAARIIGHFDDDIEHVILTHHHEDHVGAAARLGNQGAHIYAPEDAIAPLKNPPDKLGYQDRLWGRPEPVEAEPVGKRVTTPDVTLEPIPTPGHSRDHVAYLEPDRAWLFTGDAWLGRRDILRSGERLDAMLSSLETLKGLGAQRLFPGHGSIQENPTQAIQGTIDHYEDLLAQARILHEEGASPPRIRRKLLGLEAPIRYHTRGDFKKQRLADELVRLLDEGRDEPRDP